MTTHIQEITNQFLDLVSLKALYEADEAFELCGTAAKRYQLICEVDEQLTALQPLLEETNDEPTA